MRAFPVPLVPLFSYKPISVMVSLKTFISSSFPVSLKYLQMADCSLVWPPSASALGPSFTRAEPLPLILVTHWKRISQRILSFVQR